MLLFWLLACYVFLLGGFIGVNGKRSNPKYDKKNKGKKMNEPLSEKDIIYPRMSKPLPAVVKWKRVISAREWLLERRLGKKLVPICLSGKEMIVFYKEDFDKAFGEVKENGD